jgi:hypothetical protein
VAENVGYVLVNTKEQVVTSFEHVGLMQRNFLLFTAMNVNSLIILFSYCLDYYFLLSFK